MSRAGAAALVVALSLGVAAAAQAADAPTAPAPARPTSLVVALSLGDSGLQAGVVRGREVILARGFEVELARILARRLGARVAGFVNVGSPGRLLAAGSTGWHLALASIQPAGRTRSAARLSLPYLTTDYAVVLRRGLEGPGRLADLRRDVVCVVRGSGAYPVVSRAVRPARTPLVVPGPERLQAMLRTGVCDAGVVPAVDAGRLIAGQRHLLGPVAGRIAHGQGLVVAVARDGGLDVALVDRELRRLRADGTLGRLARTWLGLDPAGLRRLR
jgi:ABC-type amino acid transport substrate-binding protein